MRLWTVQRVDHVCPPTSFEVVHASWPADERWARAFRWMSEQMVIRGVARIVAPPVWAWHSCGARGAPPTTETIHMLLSDAELEQPRVLIELEVPESSALLSSYLAWNEVLHACTTTGEVRADLARRVFEVSDVLLDGSENADSIQACLPRIVRSWVVRCTPIDEGNITNPWSGFL